MLPTRPLCHLPTHLWLPWLLLLLCAPRADGPNRTAAQSKFARQCHEPRVEAPDDEARRVLLAHLLEVHRLLHLAAGASGPAGQEHTPRGLVSVHAAACTG